MVRITGMNSGLDTESIITELASARSVKVQSMQKKQTKLSWKMDAWKELNSKVYKFYTSTLDNMRFTGGYAKKTTTVSDSSVASVVTGGNAMTGTQKLKVTQLAQSGYMTGGKIAKVGTDDEGNTKYTTASVSENATLSSLGISGEIKFNLTIGGKTKELALDGNSSISSILGKLKEEGLNANFDQKNQRIFIGSKETGADANFSLSVAEDDELSAQALTALGLNTEATGDQMARKIEGQDAVIELNGAEFTSKNNTFEVNGLTITANKVSNEEVTLNTQQDTSGIYDMIKDFFKNYNELINEIDKLYGAEDASKYEPLTDEEKEEMSDKEVEEWEKKIKDSLLRRDDSLGGLRQAMFDVMGSAVTMSDGSKLYLKDFGINTLNYFTAAENEKHAYHIDGNSDDDSTKNNPDVLKGLIASDPDKVSEFFVGLTSALYKKLGDKMAKSTSSSAFTVYNDKLMKEEYQNYTSRIEKEQKKLNDYIDRWYDKFSAMEVALGKLDSKSSAISGMLGM